DTGLALAVKFSTLLLLPLYVFLYLIHGYQQSALAGSRAYRCSVGHLLKSFVIVLGVAGATVYAAYGFETSLLQHWPIPAPSFFRGILLLSQHNARGHRAYLLGEAGAGGWWYYFPVVALVKTPAGMLALFLISLGAACAIVSGKDARATALRILRA